MSREQMKARLEAATPGPWFAVRYYIGAGSDQTDPHTEVAKASFKADAEFIAHAPTDLAKLHAALDAVEAHCERIVSNADGHKPPGPPHPTPQQGVAVRILAILRDALGEDQ